MMIVICRSVVLYLFKKNCILFVEFCLFQLEDQAGNAVIIPTKERKALVLAMTLHEKGKAALKKDDFARALVFFLDADKEFR